MENNENKSWDQANQQGKNQTDFNHEGSDNNFNEKERVERNEASNDDSKPQFGGSDASENSKLKTSGTDFGNNGMNPIVNVSYTECASDEFSQEYNATISSNSENFSESDRQLDRQVL